MKDNPTIQFTRLFKEAYKKCFKQELKDPMSEAECKVLSNEIEENTGFVLGYKSIRNYSIYILGGKGKRQENPSLATLDTLARYVLDAPESNELERKKNEGHYPYWYLYQKNIASVTTTSPKSLLPVILTIPIILLALIYLINPKPLDNKEFQDDFNDLSTNTLKSNLWRVQNIDAIYWDKRGDEKGFLKLFTLQGDNWPDTSQVPLQIKNLLIRPISTDCFEAEVLILDFLPKERWQQAGIILMEDSTFSGKVLRLSIAYNDFFGGFDGPAEIIAQGITSTGNDNPEEFLHFRLFQWNEPEQLIRENLKFSRLRIEKKGVAFRFLISSGATSNAAYKEIGKHVFDMKPKYLGIFAIKGNIHESTIQPVKFDLFKWKPIRCK